MLENFRLKTEEELQAQTEQVSEVFGEEVVQPSKKEGVFDMTIQEIKEKFPVRYAMYLKVLRRNKQTDGELSGEEQKEMTGRLRVLNNLDQYIENHWVNGERTLRDRQINVFEDLRDFLEKGEKDGYIKLPTGAGKTVIFSEFIEATGLRTLIVVPTKILVEQTEEKLIEFAEDLDVGKIYSEAKKQGTDVTIITYQSLVRKIKDGTINPDDYECLVLDEAHVSLSDDRVEMVNKFNHAIRIGFTATPEYSATKNVSQILNTEIHSLGVKEAAEEGVISSFSVILAETNTDISNIKVTASGEYNQEDLQKALNVESRNKAAVELYEKMFEDELGVVYCMGIEHAEEVKRLFLENGVSTEVVSGKQNTKEQQEILAKFKSGEIKVLCNADILIAGFDEQKASVCLNLRPTLSSVVAEQRGGRVLRLDSSNPDKHATIVDFIDKNETNKVHQITFAEIANASVVYLDPKFGDKTTVKPEREESERRYVPDIKIEGLNIITDPKEVMRVVNQMKDKSEKQLLTLEELRVLLNSADIKSESQYMQYVKDNPDLGLTTDPKKRYKDWKSWFDLFGKEKKELLSTLGELKAEVRGHSFSTREEFRAYIKEHPYLPWPVNPQDKYNDWKSWPDLLGNKELLATLDELKSQVRKYGIKKTEQYRAFLQKHPELPWTTDPYKKYKDWKSWFDLFGAEKKELVATLEELKKEVRGHGFTMVKQYRTFLKKHPDLQWPSSPETKYNDWKSWSDLFGIEKKKSTITLPELKILVRKAGINSQREYFKFRKENPGLLLPSDPRNKYGDWKSWNDLLENKR